MHIVMGATGHVGSAVMTELLKEQQPLIALTRDPGKVASLRRKGAEVAIADLCDVDALRGVFARGDRVFVLNPPGNPAGDSDAEELRTIDCIVTALRQSDVSKVVVESTFGAQPDERLGDLATLYELERQLGMTSVPVSVVRAAYYMSNWDMSVDSAINDGVIRTLYPVDMPLPMVAPDDLGRVGAELLSEPPNDERCIYVEGPQRYSSNDVAAAFAAVLGRPVRAYEIPREQWMNYLGELGFSPKSAESFAAMTALTRKGGFPDFDSTIHGRISLQAYVTTLVGRTRRH